MINRYFALCSFLFVIIAGNSAAQTFSEILGRPTDSSITVSVLFDQPQQEDMYWEYGTSSGVYTQNSPVFISLANTPLEANLVNLLPDTLYYYRIRYRLNGTGGIYLSGPEHSFHTQRAPGKVFSFTIEADEHLYDKKGVQSIYQICLNNQAEDRPDFMLSLGDIFGDDHHPTTSTSNEFDSLHRAYRPFLGYICHSIPFFVCLGNHEGEKDFYLNQNPPDNIGVWGTLWRKFYYPNPFPDAFYSGDTTSEGYGMGQPENYYAWTWGDALFVVLDAYRYQCDTAPKPRGWNWTLGDQQYNWLKNTLQNSTAQYKFVFAHHLSGEVRGGILPAHYYEWGGYDNDSVTWGFGTNRPGWAMPVQQLFETYGVNIFFQGHDHLFAHEVLNNVVYQEVPMPSDSTYEIGMLANADAYTSDTLNGTGHIRVTVAPSCVRVDYVRAWLPADTLSGVHHNGEVAFSYTLGTCPASAIDEFADGQALRVYPNPATERLMIDLPSSSPLVQVHLVNMLGQVVLSTSSKELEVGSLPEGMYVLNVKTTTREINQKVLISRR